MKFDSSKKVTRDLKFKPIPELDNLCLGHIQKVEIVDIENRVTNDKGQESKYEYAGLTEPRIKFTFKNDGLGAKQPDEDRYHYHIEKPIISIKNNGEEMSEQALENLYMQMFDRLKHIYDAYEGTGNFKTMPSTIPEINEKAPAKERINQFREFFEFFVNIFNTGADKENPVFVDKDKDGNLVNVVMVMKLVAEYREGKWLEFPTFVGEGFIERYKAGKKPTIELKPSETVKLKSSDKDESKDESGGGMSESALADIIGS